MYAGKIIPKPCSTCLSRRRDAQTGYDRARTGADRLSAETSPKFKLWHIDELLLHLKRPL